NRITRPFTRPLYNKSRKIQKTNQEENKTISNASRKHSRSGISDRTFGTNEYGMIQLASEEWSKLSNGDKDFIRNFNADIRRTKRQKTTEPIGISDSTTNSGQAMKRRVVASKNGMASSKPVNSPSRPSNSNSSSRPSITFNLDDIDTLQE
ncbi:MAG: hypothetical protein ACREOZ_01275, partial [Gloeomargaritales cyanobacterium]